MNITHVLLNNNELGLTFQIAQVAVPRELCAAILERIQRFGVPPPLV
ncbi:MAG: hypothetical protein O7D91_04275 [Planctomycetota bacterium]|nr:hypothetical protein [Planctomycetota bacterium]